MTNRDIVLESIQSEPKGLTDAEIVKLTGIRPHQQVNQICRSLAEDRRITRKRGANGLIVNRAANADRHIGYASGIEVTEASVGYLVKIQASAKERAKNIVGRQWNWELKRWVYPKTTRCYEALADEFQRDADVFDIQAPGPPPDRPTKASKQDDPVNVDSPQPASNPLPELLILGELNERLVSVMDGISRLERSVDDVRALVYSESEDTSEVGRESDQSRVNDDEPDTLLFEKGLRVIAFFAAGQDPSFREWMENVKPIQDRFQFVSRSHEMLKSALVEFGGKEGIHPARFGDLVADLRDRDLLPKRPLNVAQTLFAMNDHRNWFAHPTDAGDVAVQLARSAIYLLNLALVWPLVSTPVDD